MQIKDIINSDGVKINSVVVDANNNILFTNYILRNDEKIVESCNNFNLIKPKWTGIEWIESATKEEIDEYKYKAENGIY